MSRPRTGRVYLVGAGPGDPRLITVRGAQCLGEADVVLYDALANPRLLALAPSDADTRLVGKRHGRSTVDQGEIERLIVSAARDGKTVVRLKGGDPFIFGRGGEEAQACAAAGIPFEVVPGVTSAVAVPAYAGIPLTHRDHASLVTFVTGRPGEGRTLEVDWSALVKGGGTLVFLMAVLVADDIARRLCAAGMDPDTPVAAVRWGTTPRQRTLVSTLERIGERIREDHMRPPAVIVVGDVAAMADSIAWYESLPLFGKRVLVTRARHQAAALADRLESLAAEVVEYPVIEVQPTPELRKLRSAFGEISKYDWLVLTSVNGVDRFFNEFLKDGRDIRDLAGVSIAAIGPATRRSIEARGVRVAACPGEYRAEVLAEALGDVAGTKVLVARAEEAREILPRTLREKGAEVDVLASYRTVRAEAPDPARLQDIDVITFTSASTVSCFLELSGTEGRDALDGAVIAAIGPITANRLADAGYPADVVAKDYTIPGLVDALVEYFESASV